MTVLKKCNCDHTFQDNLYGNKMRVCNETVKDGEARCTVCGTIVGGGKHKK